MNSLVNYGTVLSSPFSIPAISIASIHFSRPERIKSKKTAHTKQLSRNFIKAHDPSAWTQPRHATSQQQTYLSRKQFLALRTAPNLPPTSKKPEEKGNSPALPAALPSRIPPASTSDNEPEITSLDSL